MVLSTPTKPTIDAATVLLAGQPRSVRRVCDRVITEAGVQTRETSEVQEADSILRGSDAVSVVVCSYRIAGADWKTLLEACRRSPSKPAFVLDCGTECPPDLWAEVMTSGGFAVCTEEMPPEVVRHVVLTAHSRWVRSREIEQARSENLSSVRRR